MRTNLPIPATDHAGPAASPCNTPASVNLFQVLRQLGTLYWQLKKQEHSLQQSLPQLLPAAVRDHHAAFTPQQLKRFTKYWQLARHVVCNNLYQLTGHQLSADEEQRILLLSVFAPLFDDLFDEGILQQVQLTQLIATPEQYSPRQATDRLVQAIYLDLLKTVPDRALFIRHLQAVTNWQQESLKQLSETITEEALYRITYNKSYYGILLFCAALNHYPTPTVEIMLYPVAGLMQLTNDAFDVWKDIHQDVYTLPNLYRNFAQLQHQFMAEISSINRQLDLLPYPIAAKRHFSITIHALQAMGWLSLQQLKAATAGVSSISELKALSRKQLVCDLDSLAQKFRWVKLVHHFANFHSAIAARPYQGQPGKTPKED